MKTKWFYSTFIIILILLGISKQQKFVPNQEIVVQFANEKVSQVEAQHAITIILNQLQSIGVKISKIPEIKEGKFKISYYSDLDITSIKKILFQKNNIELEQALHKNNPTKNPNNDKSNSYDIVVYKLHENSNFKWDLEGTLVLNLKPENDRFSAPKYFTPFFKEIKDEERNIKIAIKVHKQRVLVINNFSYKIPKVRAGPIA